jgi:16S rRNA (cytosine1402-N4)-methyltransferase
MTMPAHHDSFIHATVMATEVVDWLAPRAEGVYLDLTVGGGGHSAALLARQPELRLIALDRDPSAVRAASERLAVHGDAVSVHHATFSDVRQVLDDESVERVDGLIADLGVSSPQLDDADRGMSFKREGPLDMRMDPTRGETALDLIAHLTQDQLANVIYQYGEERRSRRVARCIKQALEAGELSTTTELRRAVVRAVGPRRVGGVDPATRTFQALRLAVNGELDELTRLLEQACDLLRPGGTAVFISFHSLEDRLVKRAFRERDVWQRLTPKPQIPGEQEQAENPRSRSAKLRAGRLLPEAIDALGTYPEEIDGAY